MFRSYYGLSFNPFDKQNAREKDRFLSRDISEMTSRPVSYTHLTLPTNSLV